MQSFYYTLYVNINLPMGNIYATKVIFDKYQFNTI